MISITNEEFKKLAEYIKSNYGINLKEEKRALVTGRLQSVLAERNFKSFTEYYEYLIHDKTGTASTVLINHITTNTPFSCESRSIFIFSGTRCCRTLRKTWQAETCVFGAPAAPAARSLTPWLCSSTNFWGARSLCGTLKYRDRHLQPDPRKGKARRLSKQGSCAASSSLAPELFQENRLLHQRGFGANQKRGDIQALQPYVARLYLQKKIPRYILQERNDLFQQPNKGRACKQVLQYHGKRGLSFYWPLRDAQQGKNGLQVCNAGRLPEGMSRKSPGRPRKRHLTAEVAYADR